MTKETKKILENIIDELTELNYLQVEDIPDIALYMDQVTTFMDQHLGANRRNADDKVLTKTMINNYAKNNLLPPPDKKKYTRGHLLILVFIYYFKNILSIRDIDRVLKPITERHFAGDKKINIQEIYQEVSKKQMGLHLNGQDSAKEILELANESFAHVPKADQEHLQLFSFICSLSFDVYMKKLLIERIIDYISQE